MPPGALFLHVVPGFDNPRVIVVFFTALPEEAVFRGVVQESLARRLRGTRHGTVAAIVVAGLLFGAAHLAGGPGLNMVHLLLFTYPASQM